MAEHTPGPWHISAWEDSSLAPKLGTYAPIIFAPRGNRIAKVDGSQEDYRANAQLISAAPELLEALTRIMAYLSIHDSMFYDSNADSFKARNAIAKAKGG